MLFWLIEFAIFPFLKCSENIQRYYDLAVKGLGFSAWCLEIKSPVPQSNKPAIKYSYYTTARLKLGNVSHKLQH